MKRNVLKLFAALACAAAVVSAYAACYTYGYGVVVPSGATKNIWVFCNGTYSTIAVATMDWFATDYRLTPPSPGNYFDPAAGPGIYVTWYYTDCNGTPQPYFDPSPTPYPSVDFGSTCPYP